MCARTTTICHKRNKIAASSYLPEFDQPNRFFQSETQTQYIRLTAPRIAHLRKDFVLVHKDLMRCSKAASSRLRRDKVKCGVLVEHSCPIRRESSLRLQRIWGQMGLRALAVGCSILQCQLCMLLPLQNRTSCHKGHLYVCENEKCSLWGSNPRSYEHAP